MRWFALILLAVASAAGHAVEELEYTVREALSDQVEVRQYPAFAMARTTVQADFEDAGNVAFRPLFEYIGGDNADGQKIAMTAPVLQAPADAAVAGREQAWGVAFVMPQDATQAGLPIPGSGDVEVAAVSPGTMAAIRYSGTWSEKRFADHEAQLRKVLAERGYSVCGDAVWARYDPPVMPWFLRRNEVLLPVSAAECP